MAKLPEPSRDVRGNYKKDIGWKEAGSDKQQRFYVGRDRTEAVIRILQLEKLWSSLVGRTVPGQRPLWDTVSLSIGHAMARGETEVQITPAADLDPVALIQWLEDQQAAYPFILLRLPTDLASDADEGRKALDCEADWIEGQVNELQSKAQALKGRPSSGQTLHQALDAFWNFVKSRHSEGGRLTAFAKAESNRLDQIRNHSTNVPLAGFNLSAIDIMLTHWSNRPLTKRGTPSSVKTCKENIKTIRRFIKWLHREPSFKWRKPEDYEVEKVRVRSSAEEVAKKAPNQLPTYTHEEIGVLWQYTDPLQSLYLLLGLNCGYGIAEINTLRTSEVLLDKGKIERVRFKNTVYGEWKLWSETVEALHWYLSVRPKSNLENFFIDKEGLPYTVPTKSDNPNWHVSDSWVKLNDRMLRDRPKFRRLSFNKLRKTAANNIRRLADGETAALFLAHGKPVADDLLSHYTDRHFQKVFEAIDRFGDEVRPLFTEAKHRSDPRRLRLGPVQLQTLLEMRAQGINARVIAKEIGVTEKTVRRHSPKKS